MSLEDSFEGLGSLRFISLYHEYIQTLSKMKFLTRGTEHVFL